MSLWSSSVFIYNISCFKSVGRKWGVCYLVMADHRLNETYGTYAFTYTYIIILVVGEGYDRIGSVKWLKLQLERCFFV